MATEQTELYMSVDVGQRIHGGEVDTHDFVKHAIRGGAKGITIESFNNIVDGRTDQLTGGMKDEHMTQKIIDDPTDLQAFNGINTEDVEGMVSMVSGKTYSGTDVAENYSIFETEKTVKGGDFSLKDVPDQSVLDEYGKGQNKVQKVTPVLGDLGDATKPKMEHMTQLQHGQKEFGHDVMTDMYEKMSMKGGMDPDNLTKKDMTELKEGMADIGAMKSEGPEAEPQLHHGTTTAPEAESFYNYGMADSEDIKGGDKPTSFSSFLDESEDVMM